MKLMNRLHFDRKNTQISKVAFLHIPKCAGTSVHNTLLSHKSFRHSHLNIRVSVVNQLVPGYGLEPMRFRQAMLQYFLETGEYSYLTGHIALEPEMLVYLEKGWNFITLLREPKSRFCSDFLYASRRANVEDEELPQLFEQHLQSSQSVKQGQLMTRYLGGLHLEGVTLLQAAMQCASRLSLIGRMEELPAFEKKLAQLVGGPINLAQDNRASYPEAFRELITKPEVQDRLSNICALDIKLYESLDR